MITKDSKIILLACGTYNPLTIGHLRMMESAKDNIERMTCGKVIHGFLSPVSDSYKKKGMIPSEHRIEMLRLGVKNSDWLKIHTWEAERDCWSRTIEVVNRIKEEYNHINNLIVSLVMGGDVLDSFQVIKDDGEPLWDRNDIEYFASNGLICQVRPNSNVEETIKKLNLEKYVNNNLYTFTDVICPNDISSTKVRYGLKNNISVKYAIPDDVLNYIMENKLYQE
uniref:Nicotinamide-nucleotide adenylyltransferase n=1 Tax=Parastrongyloides trichosuri TaxID=131310 RepID=A0A0N4ZTR3_PARTI